MMFMYWLCWHLGRDLSVHMNGANGSEGLREHETCCRSEEIGMHKERVSGMDPLSPCLSKSHGGKARAYTGSKKD